MPTYLRTHAHFLTVELNNKEFKSRDETLIHTFSAWDQRINVNRVSAA